MTQMLGLTAAQLTVRLLSTRESCHQHHFSSALFEQQFLDLHEHMLEEKIYEKQNLIQEKHIRKLYRQGIPGPLAHWHNFENYPFDSVGVYQNCTNVRVQRISSASGMNSCSYESFSILNGSNHKSGIRPLFGPTKSTSCFVETGLCGL